MAGLYLYSPEFDADDQSIIAQGMFRIDRHSVIPIKDWRTMAAVVKRHQAIANLVFSFHGEAGGMTVGDHNYYLDDKFVTALFDKAPKVENIAFISCSVGLGPAKMWMFAKLFGASSVSGYTWWLVTQDFNITFPKGTDENTISEKLDPFKPYTVEDLPAARVLQVHLRPIKIVALYGSSDQTTASRVPIPSSESKDHKPWTEATKTSIRAAAAAAAEKGYAANPVPTFEKVTVVA